MRLSDSPWGEQGKSLERFFTITAPLESIALPAGLQSGVLLSSVSGYLGDVLWLQLIFGNLLDVWPASCLCAQSNQLQNLS